MKYEKEFLSIVRKDKELINILKEVRKLNLPDWYLAGGAIRNMVWDSLHGFKQKTPLNDIDVVYFNENDLSSKKDSEFEKILTEKMSNFKWNVFNQARSHIRNPKVPKVKNTSDGIAYWSEISNCIGVRIEKDGKINICAPHGISDLMELKVKPVPKPYENLDLYRERIKEKKWKDIWNKLDIKDV